MSFCRENVGKCVMFKHTRWWCFLSMFCSSFYRFFETLRRKVYTTPKSYLDMIHLYLSLLEMKREEIHVSKSRWVLLFTIDHVLFSFCDWNPTTHGAIQTDWFFNPSPLHETFLCTVLLRTFARLCQAASSAYISIVVMASSILWCPPPLAQYASTRLIVGLTLVFKN